MTSSSTISRATAVWTLIGLVLLTVNLRAAITGIAPMLGDLQPAFGLTGVEVSVLTTLPVLCLGFFASLAPVLARRIGAESVIAAALLMITIGIVLRLVPSRIALFAGTVLAGAGIAMGNVLLPAVIKRFFPGRIGSLTGAAMMLMAISGAIAAGLAVPLDEAAGWRVALAVWAVPSALALLAWGPLAVHGLRRDRRDRHDQRECRECRERRAAGSRGQDDPGRGAGYGSPLRSPLAWFITGFMGLASLMFYVLMSWLPEIMRDHGQPAAVAGSMVSVMMIVGVPLGYVTPVVAARMRDQRPMAVAIGLVMAAGLGGLLFSPELGWVWVGVLGVGAGAAFPLAFTLLSLRAPTPAVAARLSGMAQTGGYLLAGLGPLAFGVLHSVTGGWDVSLTLLLALIVPETLLGVLAARPGFVRTVVSGRDGDVDGLLGGAAERDEEEGARVPVPAR